MARDPLVRIERRLFWVGVSLVAGGSLVTWALFDLMIAVSFLAGGILAGGNFLWLGRTMHSFFGTDPAAAKRRVLAGYFLRLLLIPLCLYAMIRFLFLSIPAAVAGFAVFNCSVFVEGILEAFESSSR